jgi:DNA-binding MarR family transcriptional regulator
MQTESSHKAGIKLIYLLKRFMDEWNEKNLCSLRCPGFNSAQLPLFMTIGKTPISNNEAAAKLNISKQASSKILKELEAINMVQSEKSTADGRAVMLKLTNEGEAYYNYVLTQITELEGKYKKLVGAKNYETALEVMAKLVEFHEKQSC